MGLKMIERAAVVREMRGRYERASKKGKGEILNELCRLTGYNRCYATQVLKRKKAIVAKKGERVRQREYGEEEVSALKKIWVIMDCVCGKRLAPNIKELIGVLERHRELRISRETRRKLESISAATIDRLLAPARKEFLVGSRSRTKPGTLLKSQIPIRTFSEWNETEPGFVEIDLVGHDGGNGSGDFAQTLDVTDISSAWTETQAVRNKAQVYVFDALLSIRERLPFPLLGIDSDNGSEFINDQLLSYCRAERITFTRSRSGRKNDGCYVEQKNYSIVRRHVGYSRHDSDEEVQLLNLLYGHLRLYTNYFQPVMKLISKRRVGARVSKTYDRAKAPYQRLLESPHVERAVKLKLRRQYEQLNPAELKRAILQCQNRLLEIASARSRLPQVGKRRAVPSTHPWKSTFLRPKTNADG